jgi:hypothetical protein
MINEEIGKWRISEIGTSLFRKRYCSLAKGLGKTRP